jgi:ribosomal protein L29
MDQLRADASRILKLESGLTDLRELSAADAHELIAELRRAIADERVSNE